MTDKLFVVLGMHRSATSLIAKGLADNGVDMGPDDIGPHESNPYGHHEDGTFVAANDAILEASGGTWDRPPSTLVDADVTELMGQRSGMWGWKDPRTALTFPIYEPHLGDDPHLVCVFRRPTQVARSLHQRDGIPVSYGEQLAREYDRRILVNASRFCGLI